MLPSDRIGCYGTMLSDSDPPTFKAGDRCPGFIAEAGRCLQREPRTSRLGSKPKSSHSDHSENRSLRVVRPGAQIVCSPNSYIRQLHPNDISDAADDVAVRGEPSC